MAIVENKYHLRIVITTTITTFLILFLGIEFEFISKILMIIGSLTVAYKTLLFLGIIKYLDTSRAERMKKRFLKKLEKQRLREEKKARRKKNVRGL